MSLCFETVLSLKGKPQNLKFHQQRLDYTQSKLYQNYEKIDLNSLISPPKEYDCRVRVVYGKKVVKTEYLELKKRSFKNFRLVESEIEYPFKFVDRESLDSLRVEGFDDVIIHKNGELRDTLIANIALFIDNRWFTPKNPLLYGTTRERLIREGFMQERRLYVEDLEKASNFAIMNALIGLCEIGGDFSVT